jgi:formylglycine-generating enzyme required for sulfatase activity
LPFCTYSSANEGRDSFPVNCIVWADARAFCKFEGGDLPSEVQWEWVASQAGRTEKTAYPWGGPDLESFPCTRGVFGRGYLNACTPGACLSLGLGPASVTLADHVNGDHSVGFGVVDLGGNVAELLLDSYDDLASRCWLDQPILATSCRDPANVFHSIRGGEWTHNSDSAVYDNRSYIPFDAIDTGTGFRCVRRGMP